MTWTYSGSPATSTRDQVRFLTGDTSDLDEQLQDEEIDWLLTQTSSVYRAAAQGCEAIASKYARLIDKTVGSLSIRYSQRRDFYLTLAATLTVRSHGRGVGAKPFYGNADATNPTREGVLRLNTMRVDGGNYDERRSTQ